MAGLRGWCVLCRTSPPSIVSSYTVCLVWVVRCVFLGYSSLVLSSEGGLARYQAQVLGLYRVVGKHRDTFLYRREGADIFLYYRYISYT